MGGGDWQVQWQRHVGMPLRIASIDYEAFGETSNYGIAGSARSNLRDYGQVLHMLLNDGWSNGSRVLHPASVRAIFNDRVGSLPIAYAPANAMPPIRYGLGNWLDDTRIVNAEGPFGHSLGLFGFFPFVDFERAVFGIFMLKGPAGFNDTALPVYEQMLASVGNELDAYDCDEIELFAAIAGDGFESPQVVLSTQ
jgi:CubicO group peptidase (beta-lactamase class C family)